MRDRVMGADYTHFSKDRQTPESAVCSLAPSGHNGGIAYLHFEHIPEGSPVSQSLIAALQNPALFPHPVENFQLIETHISWVLLTGPYAYKDRKSVV